MASSACTFNGCNNYNNGWAQGKVLNNNSRLGSLCLGLCSNGSWRYYVCSFTTPDVSPISSVTVRIPMVGDYAATITPNCAISKVGPTWAASPGTAAGADPEWYNAVDNNNLIVNKSLSVTVKAASSSATNGNYQYVDFTLSCSLARKTTYYFWMGMGGWNTIYYRHDNTMSCTVSVGQSDPSFYAPSVSLSGNSGFYGGATLYVSNHSSYPIIYIGNSSSGPFWRKATSGTSAKLDADTSSTSKTIYVVRSNIDVGTYLASASTCTTFSVPRFACTIYNMSSSGTVYSGNSGSIGISYSGLTLQGLATSSGTTSVSYSANWSNGTNLNGKTWYAVYSQNSTITYYRGSSSSNSVTSTRYGYGTGSYTSWSVSEPTRTCLSNSSYSFQGWSTSSSSTSTSYSSLAAARIGGYTTLYGVYKLNASSTDSTKYYYRGSSAKQSVTQTQSVSAGYYYGTGSHTGRNTTYSYGSISTSCLSNSNYSLIGWTTGSGTSTSYGADLSGLYSAWQAGNDTVYGVYKWNYNITYNSQNPSGSGISSATRYYYYTGSASGNWPTEPSLTYKYHTLLGWSTSSSGSPNTWASLTRSGTKTLYAIWKTNNQIYYGINGAWKLCNVYYGVNGVWKPISIIKFGSGGNWLSS